MSTSSERRFAALVDHDGVTLIEYRLERSGFRVVQEWSERQRSDSVDALAARLRELILEQKPRRARLAMVLQHFGAFFHEMTLPGAADGVLRPIISREVQRVYGVADPVFAYNSGASAERRSPERADARTAPRQIFIGGAPSATIESLRVGLEGAPIAVDCITVVPEALRRVFGAVPRSGDVTAVLACLSSGPQLAFFLEGRLQLSIDPPIALEGESTDVVATAVAQMERGAVYFRQQFGGAQASQLLLAAPREIYDVVAAALEQRVRTRVQPLMPQMPSAEAVIAMGAVLEADSTDAIDLYPHPPTFGDRVHSALSGARALATTAIAAGLLVSLWGATEMAELVAARSQVKRETASLNQALGSMSPIQAAASRRAAYSQIVQTVSAVDSERRLLADQLAAISGLMPNSLTFDSLSVTRTEAGWNGVVGGRIVAPAAAEAVRSLNSFYQSLRLRPGITSTSLDQFDYPTTPRDTASAAAESEITLRFRISFAVAATAGKS